MFGTVSKSDVKAYEHKKAARMALTLTTHFNETKFMKLSAKKLAKV